MSLIVVWKIQSVLHFPSPSTQEENHPIRPLSVDFPIRASYYKEFGVVALDLFMGSGACSFSLMRVSSLSYGV
jgi:hypothetical protein